MTCISNISDCVIPLWAKNAELWDDGAMTQLSERFAWLCVFRTIVTTISGRT